MLSFDFYLTQSLMGPFDFPFYWSLYYIVSIKYTFPTNG